MTPPKGMRLVDLDVTARIIAPGSFAAIDIDDNDVRFIVKDEIERVLSKAFAGRGERPDGTISVVVVVRPR